MMLDRRKLSGAPGEGLTVLDSLEDNIMCGGGYMDVAEGGRERNKDK